MFTEKVLTAYIYSIVVVTIICCILAMGVVAYEGATHGGLRQPCNENATCDYETLACVREGSGGGIYCCLPVQGKPRGTDD